MSQTEQQRLIELYDWLDTIPFSRMKRNLARDFSDGVLAAELVKFFVPTLVDLHNYPSTNTLDQKKVNWDTLNKKVLKKLDFPLSEATRNELALAKRDAVEYFLSHLREKLNSYVKKEQNRINLKKKELLLENLKITDNIVNYSTLSDRTSVNTETSTSNESMDKDKWLPRGSIKNGSVPMEMYEQRVQELLAEKQDTILNLKSRIRDLEYILLHKDHTINDLRAQLKEYLQIGVCKESDMRSKHKFSPSTT